MPQNSCPWHQRRQAATQPHMETNVLLPSPNPALTATAARASSRAARCACSRCSLCNIGIGEKPAY